MPNNKEIEFADVLKEDFPKFSEGKYFYVAGEVLAIALRDREVITKVIKYGNKSDSVSC